MLATKYITSPNNTKPPQTQLGCSCRPEQLSPVASNQDSFLFLLYFQRLTSSLITMYLFYVRQIILCKYSRENNMMEYFLRANVRFLSVRAGSSATMHIGYKAKTENPKYTENGTQSRYITVPRTLCPSRANPKKIIAESGKFEVTCAKCREYVLKDPAYNKETREFDIDYANKIYNEPK